MGSKYKENVGPKSGLKSRKDLRKQIRKEKKAKKNDYFKNKKKKAMILSSTYSSKPKDDFKSRFNSKKNNKPIIQRNEGAPSIKQPPIETKKVKFSTLSLLDEQNKHHKEELREKAKLERGMIKSRKKMLFEANKIEDKEIKKLEKQLKLNKRKSKSIPKSFMDEGLDYVSDIDKLNEAGAAEGNLFGTDDKFGDFAEITGKNKRKLVSDDEIPNKKKKASTPMKKLKEGLLAEEDVSNYDYEQSLYSDSSDVVDNFVNYNDEGENSSINTMYADVKSGWLDESTMEEIKNIDDEVSNEDSIPNDNNYNDDNFDINSMNTDIESEFEEDRIGGRKNILDNELSNETNSYIDDSSHNAYSDHNNSHNDDSDHNDSHDDDSDHNDSHDDDSDHNDDDSDHNDGHDDDSDHNDSHDDDSDHNDNHDDDDSDHNDNHDDDDRDHNDSHDDDSDHNDSHDDDSEHNDSHDDDSEHNDSHNDDSDHNDDNSDHNDNHDDDDSDHNDNHDDDDRDHNDSHDDDSDHNDSHDDDSDHNDSHDYDSDHNDSHDDDSDHNDSHDDDSDHNDGHDDDSDHNDSHDDDSDHNDNHDDDDSDHNDNHDDDDRDHNDSHDDDSDHNDSHDDDSEHNDSHDDDSDSHNDESDHSDSHNDNSDHNDSHNDDSDHRDSHNNYSDHNDSHDDDSDRDDSHDDDSDHNDDDSDHNDGHDDDSDHNDSHDDDSDHNDNHDDDDSDHNDNHDGDDRDHNDSHDDDSDHNDSHNDDSDHNDSHDDDRDHNDSHDDDSEHNDSHDDDSEHNDSHDDDSEHNDSHDDDSDHSERHNDDSDSHNDESDHSDSHNDNSDHNDSHNDDSDHSDSHNNYSDHNDSHNDNSDHNGHGTHYDNNFNNNNVDSENDDINYINTDNESEFEEERTGGITNILDNEVSNESNSYIDDSSHNDESDHNDSHNDFGDHNDGSDSHNDESDQNDSHNDDSDCNDSRNDESDHNDGNSYNDCHNDDSDHNDDSSHNDNNIDKDNADMENVDINSLNTDNESEFEEERTGEITNILDNEVSNESNSYIDDSSHNDESDHNDSHNDFGDHNDGSDSHNDESDQNDSHNDDSDHNDDSSLSNINSDTDNNSSENDYINSFNTDNKSIFQNERTQEFLNTDDEITNDSNTDNDKSSHNDDYFDNDTVDSENDDMNTDGNSKFENDSSEEIKYTFYKVTNESNTDSDDSSNNEDNNVDSENDYLNTDHESKTDIESSEEIKNVNNEDDEGGSESNTEDDDSNSDNKEDNELSYNLLEVCDTDKLNEAGAAEGNLFGSDDEFGDDVAQITGKNKRKLVSDDEIPNRKKKESAPINLTKEGLLSEENSSNDEKEESIDSDGSHDEENFENDLDSENDKINTMDSEDESEDQSAEEIKNKVFEDDEVVNESDSENDDNNSDDAEDNELSESIDSSEKRDSDKAIRKENGTWEDIYGRLRDKKGNVIQIQEKGKYIPPHLRAQQQGDEAKRFEELARLKKQLKGLINRLAESNIRSIANQIDELYMRNSRNDMNDCLLSLISEALISRVLTPERLIMEQTMLIAILHANVGMEVGAHFLECFVQKFSKLFDQSQEVENKELDNILLVISHLYNFKVFHAVLLYNILDQLVERFTEKEVELILLVLRSVGLSMRKDDPLALKNLVLRLQKKAHESTHLRDNTRVKFMLDVLLAVKNNNMTKIPQYDPSHSEHLKKLIKTLVHKGKYVTELKVTLEDLLKAEERGRWWIVGSAWSGAPTSVSAATQTTAVTPGSQFSQTVLELARKQRMNTDTRRNIFCILITAEDYLDAFEKLLRLGLKGHQEQEIVHVMVHCLLSEKVYNPYYAHLANHFCQADRRHQMTIQYHVWDKVKELSNLSQSQITNLAKFLAHLFLEKALPISVLKVLQFSEMDKRCVRLLRQVLLTVLLNDSVEVMTAVFLRVARSEKLRMFRESLRLFLHHFVLRNVSDLPQDQADLIQERVKLAETALVSVDTSVKLL